MTPTEMRELAKWHDEIACELMIGSDEPEFPIEAVDEAGKYAKSAKIIRWAADVPETEYVAWFDCGGFGVVSDYEGPGLADRQLIFKPTFEGDEP